MAMIAGPCAIESREVLDEIAGHIKQAGANMLRGGAFKPRTSPYSFQGMGEEGLKILRRVGDETGQDLRDCNVRPRALDRIGQFEQPAAFGRLIGITV